MPESLASRPTSFLSPPHIDHSRRDPRSMCRAGVRWHSALRRAWVQPGESQPVLAKPEPKSTHLNGPHQWVGPAEGAS